jgi:hypothetical protein
MKIEVKPEQMLMLEKYQYELNGLIVLLNEFIGDETQYAIALDKYTEKFKEVEVIKNALMTEYVTPILDENQTVNCNFDFTQSVIFVQSSQEAITV